ncbi:hypothetical protein GOP47_0026991 [Adiantum capillus-veneris]|nr:hypothetical protein GOP47_0026991 [Adiantum capillus-veneris]
MARRRDQYKENKPNESSVLHYVERMLHNADFHDMVFVCGDQQVEVGACRMIMAARSPVLESMLIHSGMEESRLARIHLPAIDPQAMRICVEFLYTDVVQGTSWQGILSAMKVVEAAMFFLLVRLERLAITYMHTTSFRSQTEDEEWVSNIVAAYNLGVHLFPAHLSKKYKGLRNMSNLLDKFRVYVQNRLGCSTENLFSKCRRERFIHRNLSEAAFLHVIEHSLEHPLTEYFTFLHVVRWTALRYVLSDAAIQEDELEDILNRCIPRSLDLLSSSTIVDIDDERVRWVLGLLSRWLSQTLPTFPLNFAMISTDILCRFIEPLHIIPEVTLFSTYRMQALSRADLSWDPLGHASNYCIDSDDNSVISSDGRKHFTGFARCGTYISVAKDTFSKWEIAVLTPCSKFRIGFYIHRPDMPLDFFQTSWQVLGEECGSWALGNDGKLYSMDFAGTKGVAEYVNPLEGEVVVQVQLKPQKKGSCSFSINGKAAGMAWKNIPFRNHIAYPAVSLLYPGKVQVRRVWHKWMEGPSERLYSSSLEDC